MPITRRAAAKAKAKADDQKPPQSSNKTTSKSFDKKRKGAQSAETSRKVAKRDPSLDPQRSPWDQIERKQIRVEDLDLSQPHDPPPSSTIRPPEVQRPPRHKRWQRTGREAITDITDLPEGWSMTEPDLDPRDTDAQIERCLERIEDRIMPKAFEYKLQDLRKQKHESEALASLDPPELHGRTLQRWRTLEHMRKVVVKHGDKDNQLPNIEAILKAYRTKRLEWIGLVTYWSGGTQLCQPRKFDWDELEAIRSHSSGKEGFWCEGMLGPGPGSMGPCIIIPISENYIFYYKVAFRLPGFPWWDEFEVMYDTGCGTAGVFEDDMKQLMGPYRAPEYKVPILGYFMGTTFDGVTCNRAIEVEVTLLDGKGRRMTNWTRVLCLLMDGSYKPGKNFRVDGPWIRQCLYTGSAPLDWPGMHIATSKSSLHLPDVPTQNINTAVYQDVIEPNSDSAAEFELDLTEDNRLTGPVMPKVMPQPARPIVTPKPSSLKKKD